jgi:IclR family transcriptional regulator, pca regulon regulatory protein
MISAAREGKPPMAATDPDFMTSLARGLAVLRCFAEQERPMTIAQASQLTGFSRPAVRRCLHTLVQLGYVEKSGSKYVLRPKVMMLGYAYLSSTPLAVRAQALLDALRDELGESCSLGVMEDDELCYIARAETSRIMTVALRVGSRLPLYPTSMGRVLLSGMSPAERSAYFARVQPAAITRFTEIRTGNLQAICDKVAQDGFAIVDQELELGLCSVAVPVYAMNGRIVAAINIGTSTHRYSEAELRIRLLPALRDCARDITAMVRT